ncbi:MAG TPA: hypothetical protein VMI54_06645 [Polyangiaceae bacterium]|nr:hypothetical protein [Polyangiaceae bacterium]
MAFGGGTEPTSNTAERLGSLVAELQALNRRRGFDRTLAVGELILREFFGGDPAAWRDQSRKKAQSLRRLAARTDCPFRKSTLNEAVCVHVALLEQPNLRRSELITASHIASVLRLAAPERERLLEQAEKERWSVRQLRSHVRAHASAQGAETRLSWLDSGMRAVLLLQRSLADAQAIVGQLGAIGPLSVRSRAELKELSNVVLNLGSDLANLANDPVAAPELRRSELRLREGEGEGELLDEEAARV